MDGKTKGKESLLPPLLKWVEGSNGEPSLGIWPLLCRPEEAEKAGCEGRTEVSMLGTRGA